jgi:hypothetical protein
VEDLLATGLQIEKEQSAVRVDEPAASSALGHIPLRDFKTVLQVTVID